MKKRNILDTSFVKVVLLAICIFFAYRLIFDFEGLSASVSNILSFFFNLLGYFVWGFAIAFILNQIMIFFEKLLRFIKKEKVRRVIAILTTYLVALSAIVLFFVAVIPVIGNSLRDLVDNIPVYAAKLQDFYGKVQTGLAELGIYLESEFDSVALLERIADLFINGNGIGVVTQWLFETTNVLLNCFFGFIISIYMLADKKKFLLGISNVMEAMMSEKKAERVREIAGRANYLFSRFLFGKLIDSTIVGICCYVAFLLIGVKYPLLLAFIIGVTNIIPYFGPIAGGVVVGAIVLFTHSEIYYFIITILVVLAIQQFDAWVIDPHIQQGRIGIHPLLVIAGVSIGGSLGGFVGMVVGVPLLALMKELFYDGYIMKKLQARKGKAENEMEGSNDGLA